MAHLAMPEVATRFAQVDLGAAHYESVYLKAAAPGGGRAVWLRHTVLKRPGAAPSGAVWLTVFDRARPSPQAVRVPGPARVPGGGWIEVAGCRVGPGEAAGALDGAEWDLRFEALEPPAHHLPARRLYDAPLPRTKSLSPVPVARFAGALRLGTTALDLTGWTGMVGHNWGSEHAERWIWLHGVDDGGWIDVVLGRVRVGPVVLPWLATGLVCLGGRRHRVLPGPRPVVRADASGAALALRAGGAALHAEVRVPPGTAVAWRYASPAGGERRTVNCSVADLEVQSGGGRLAVAGAAAYELGGGDGDDVPLAAPDPG